MPPSPSYENLEIIGDNSTSAGIAIQPPSERVEVLECKIHGMGLANPGNDYPLAELMDNTEICDWYHTKGWEHTQEILESLND